MKVADVATAGGLMVVGSLAESLLVLVSPPPETAAMLVTLEGALPATFTVRVIAGKPAPAAKLSVRVHGPDG